MREPKRATCPVCGSDDIMAEGSHITLAKAWCRMECQHCHTYGPKTYKVRSKPNTCDSMRKRAIQAWNRWAGDGPLHWFLGVDLAGGGADLGAQEMGAYAINAYGGGRTVCLALKIFPAGNPPEKIRVCRRTLSLAEIVRKELMPGRGGFLELVIQRTNKTELLGLKADALILDENCNLDT